VYLASLSCICEQAEMRLNRQTNEFKMMENSEKGYDDRATVQTMV
jgi:hypothetical protein